MKVSFSLFLNFFFILQLIDFCCWTELIFCANFEKLPGKMQLNVWHFSLPTVSLHAKEIFTFPTTFLLCKNVRCDFFLWKKFCAWKRSLWWCWPESENLVFNQEIYQISTRLSVNCHRHCEFTNERKILVSKWFFKKQFIQIISLENRLNVLDIFSIFFS